MTDKFKALYKKRMRDGRREHGDYKKFPAMCKVWLDELQDEAADIFNYTEMFEHDFQRGHEIMFRVSELRDRLKDIAREAYEIAGEQPKVNVLKQRVEALELGRVPAGGLMLAAGVDVQKDRIEVEVDAFGRGEECWVVDHQVIHGDPAKRGPDSVWEALAMLRGKAYLHAGGQTLRIAAMAVDSGYLTQDVYDHCRRWAHKHVFATKGANESGKPVLSRPRWVDIDCRGQKIKRGVQLWFVGTDTAKERFYRRLELDEPGPGYQHFPRGLSDEYFEQLASEKLLRRRVRGVEKHEWVKTRDRNEALDLKILCYAAAIYARLQTQNWDQLERIINPTQQDLFIEGAVAAARAAAGSAATPAERMHTSVPAAAPTRLISVPAGKSRNLGRVLGAGH